MRDWFLSGMASCFQPRGLEPVIQRVIALHYISVFSQETAFVPVPKVSSVLSLAATVPRSRLWYTMVTICNNSSLLPANEQRKMKNVKYVVLDMHKRIVISK